MAYRDSLSKHLEEHKQNDVIEGPLDSGMPMEWLSNVVMTEKEEAGKIRMNLDMRHTIVAIKVPSVHILRHKLNAATAFTKLDLRHSFHQMHLGDKSRELTNTHEGIYRFVVH